MRQRGQQTMPSGLLGVDWTGDQHLFPLKFCRQLLEYLTFIQYSVSIGPRCSTGTRGSGQTRDTRSQECERKGNGGRMFTKGTGGIRNGGQLLAKGRRVAKATVHQCVGAHV